MSTVIIGSGPNGLAAAYYLAKAGLKPLVLERSARVGGGAITREIEPGFHCPALSHEVLLHKRIVREMKLRKHGLELVTGDVDTCAVSPDKPAVTLYTDPARCAQGLRNVNAHDARTWQGFRTAIARAAAVLAPVLGAPPPDIDDPGARDLFRLLNTGRRFRALGTHRAHRLLRWLPMPVADLLDEWFEDDLLKAAVAGPGVSGTMLGPRSAGSALVLLLREAHRRLAGGHALHVRGGPGALTGAMAAAARAAGADIREQTAVERILIRDGRVAGVIAAGREIPATTVVSAVDPRTTMLALVDPQDVAPDVLVKFRNYRASGTVAKVNLALTELPKFSGVVGGQKLLSGHVHVGPGLDYLERAFDHAKYGELSNEPWLDITIPSLLDPSLAPPGAHVASIYVHCAPHRLKEGEANGLRERVLHRTLTILERHAPGISPTVVASEVISPADLELEYGLAGGQMFHGELAPDQLYAMRPVIGYGRYAGPVRGLYFCGGGTHPGGFLTGASGRLGAAEILKSNDRRVERV
jgi:phytoene dehydrogenase-like protein